MILTFCDKNKELVKKVKQLFKDNKDNKAGFELKISKFNDVFEEQEKNGGLICTASNPKFSMGGGLDKQIKDKFNLKEEEIKEFQATDKIFPIVTVDDSIQSDKQIIRRALSGMFLYRYRYNYILTGIGTAIGGLDEEIFLQELEYILDANLSSANLCYANLSSANLSYADLCYANLSEAKNIITMADWFDKTFKHNTKGYIVYKAIGNTSYTPREEWKIKAGEYLTENVNRNSYDLCGCGVNFGTLEFIKQNYRDAKEIWECLIEYKDLVDTIVPINSDGKARTSRLKLIKKL